MLFNLTTNGCILFIFIHNTCTTLFGIILQPAIHVIFPMMPVTTSTLAVSLNNIIISVNKSSLKLCSAITRVINSSSSIKTIIFDSDLTNGYERDVKVITEVLNKVSSTFNASKSTTLLSKLYDVGLYKSRLEYLNLHHISDELIIASRSLPDLRSILNHIIVTKSGNCGERALIACLIFISKGFFEEVTFIKYAGLDHELISFRGEVATWIVDPWILRFYEENEINNRCFSVYKAYSEMIPMDGGPIVKKGLLDALSSNYINLFLKGKEFEC